MIPLRQLIVNLAIVLLGQVLANQIVLYYPGDNIARLQTELSVCNREDTYYSIMAGSRQGSLAKTELSDAPTPTTLLFYEILFIKVSVKTSNYLSLGCIVIILADLIVYCITLEPIFDPQAAPAA